MKLTEYFLKDCQSCPPEVKENLKLIGPVGNLKVIIGNYIEYAD